MSTNTNSGFLTGIDERNADGTLVNGDLALPGFEGSPGEYRLVGRHLCQVSGEYRNTGTEEIRFRPRMVGSWSVIWYDGSVGGQINKTNNTVTLAPGAMVIVDMSYETGINTIPSVRPGGEHQVNLGAQAEAGFTLLDGVPEITTRWATNNILAYEELRVDETQQAAVVIRTLFRALLCDGSSSQGC